VSTSNWTAAGFGLAFACAASPGYAMSNPDFISVEEHTESGKAIALQLALRTEALRAENTGRKDKATCIQNNFVVVEQPNPVSEYVPHNYEILRNVIDTTNTPTTTTEGLINAAIEVICGDEVIGQKVPIPERLTTQVFTATDFLATVRVAKDRSLVLMLPAAVQAIRVEITDPAYAKCIRTQFTVNKGVTVAPQGYSDMYRTLVANKRGGSKEAVEQTILNAIAGTCGTDPKPN
jgi:hypothetical protein